MAIQSDFEYFTARASAERELSEVAADPAAAAIHAKLADCYEKLARETGAPRPTLRIVTPQGRQAEAASPGLAGNWSR